MPKTTPEQNKKIVLKAFDTLFNQRDYRSVVTALGARTPAVIIPTIRERESNARRLASLGAGEVVMPVNGADGEKLVDVAEFGMKVKRVLNEPSYRQSAKRVAESMRHFGGAWAAAERIEEGVLVQGVKSR
jgi:zeaxanthin glucosyltransferase